MTEAVQDARQRLVEVGGRTSQDLGLGRIPGQILVFLYLRENECSLDEIEAELGLSKAAVSTSAKQLENLGLLRRVWRKGDRKCYYRTADDMATALQQGVLVFMKQRMQQVSGELDAAATTLKDAADGGANGDVRFVLKRVKRAQQLRDRIARILRSPILRIFAR